MTVTSETRSIAYTDAGQTVFPIPFSFLENAHILARFDSTALALDVNYTLSGAGEGAGAGLLTLLTPMTSGQTLTIERLVPITQPASFGYGGKFSAKVHERAFDRLTMIAQQLAAASPLWLNLVTDGGAKGDGTLEDVAALQAFLNANPGRMIFVPRGQYLVDAPLTLPAGTELIGESTPGQIGGWTTADFTPPNDGSRFQCSGASSEVFRLTNPRTGLRNMTIEHTSPLTAASGALVFIQTQLTHLENVTICGGYDNVHLAGTDAVNTTSWHQIDRCIFSLANNAAVHIDGTTALVNDVWMRGVMILNDPRGWNVPAAAVGTGVLIEGYVEAITATDLSIWGGAKSMTVTSTTYTRGTCPTGLKFNDCWFDTASDIASINHAINVRFMSCWFVGSRTAGKHGMTVHSCTDVRFVGCEFNYNMATGAYVQGSDGSCKDISFIGCNSSNNSVGGGGRGYYVNFDGSNVDGVTFIGCSTTPWPGASGGPNEIGIETSTGAAAHLMIANCTVLGNMNAQITDNTTGGTKTIVNNFTA